MPNPLTPAERAKRAAAARALEFVTDGMVLGLGTGSTAWHFVDLLADRIAAGGLDVRCVPTSSRTRAQAEERGVPLVTLDEAPELDLTVDGADEFDAHLNLIKGGGGALLQEKIVAAASRRIVVISDASKQVETLGAFPLAVEIVRFGHLHTARQIGRLLEGADVDGTRAILRHGSGGPYRTDECHHILDLHLGRIGDAERLNAELNAVPGVVETGLFIGLADVVVVGDEDGETRLIER